MSKVQKKMDNFFPKEFKKNTETTEQEQNISLSSKEIISPEPLAFKGFPTNTMTKNSVSVSVSHLKLKQTKSPTIKSMTQSLPSRSNQDEFSKLNTAPQSAETVVHDKNTKEHFKNKINQKDLPQLITNISATSLKLKNSAQKVLGKQIKKQRVSRQQSFHLFPRKTFIQVIYVYTVIKACQT